MQRATRISVCVIAVSKSYEFLLKIRRLSSFFSTTTRRNFFHDDARDSTLTRSRCFSTTSDTTQLWSFKPQVTLIWF